MVDEPVVVTEPGVTETPPAPVEIEEGVKPGESPTPKEGEKPEDSPTPKVSPGVQKRFNEMTADKRRLTDTVAERDARITELEAEKLNSDLAKIERPNRENFEDEKSYLDSVDVYNDARQDRRQQEKANKATKVAAGNAAQEAWAPFNESAAKLDPGQYPDIDKAMSGEGIKYSGLSAEFVRTSPVGPQMAYHLYQNPDLSEKIARMSISEQTQALVNLQGEVVKSSTSRTQTNAPPPITPVGGSGGVVQKDSDKMSEREWLDWRNRTKKIT